VELLSGAGRGLLDWGWAVIKPVPVDAQRSDWPRLVANAINTLINRKPQSEDVRYHAGVMQYYDGTDWVDVP